ncbi:glycosyltransferase family 4 protein [Paenibacillus harenae]|uniref:glycosyltransferase family 4 protein n=1 Tax=Paenibacillus harenae TaxID=306543 RepID=UPI0003FE5460|nr:glycosyltransferase family 4 protein [Paenibacillus harenae]
MKVLIISPVSIIENMAGPSIRYYNFYLELCKEHEVIILLPSSSKNTIINSEKLSNKTIKKWSNWCDVIITQGLTIFNYPIIKKTKKPLVIDLYDPFILENLEIRKDNVLGNTQYELDLHILKTQLFLGDYFICSNPRQLHYWAGSLSILGVINPTNYLNSPKLTDWIDLVPFGIPNTEPIQNFHGIRNSSTNISKDDFVVVWGGGVWEWLDISIVIEAFAIIKNQDLRIKMYIMGGRNNNKLHQLIQKYEVQESVILGEWIAYEKRQNYLIDADLGIIAHYNNWETEFSHRTRVLDYIWCNVPVISTGGDYITELIEKEGFGLSYGSQKSDILAELLLKLNKNRDVLKEMKRNQNKIIDNLRWVKVIQPLNQFCKAPVKRKKTSMPIYTKLFRPILSLIKKLRHKRRV